MKLLATIVTVYLLIIQSAQSHAAEELSDAQIRTLSVIALFDTPRKSVPALAKLVERGKRDVMPILVLASRFSSNPEIITKAMSDISGQKITSWREALLWQEAHPKVVPHESYRDLKLELLRRIDPEFLQFLGGERSHQENMDIRLEEITWGGVRVDGIPSLDNPRQVAAKDADYLVETDLVFGVSINGDTRAYPLRIMGWHEMFNEVIGGVPVALAYCTLCGAGILFETKLDEFDEQLIFGSSGFLYRSNKLMFDRRTNSLWNQFTGEPVAGPLRGKNIKLKIRPVTITTWKNWLTQYPQTKVLSVETGFNRDYGSGVVYNEYFASPGLMFPTLVRDESQVQRKEFVFGIREYGTARAWPLKAFETNKVINDKIGSRNLVLVGDAATRTVRAYERGDFEFQSSDQANQIKGPKTNWRMNENALVSNDGRKLPRIAGHISYWFAWDGYLGAKSSLFSPTGAK